MTAAIVKELGNRVSAPDMALIARCVDLLHYKPRSHTDRTRNVNTADRILTQLRERYVKATTPSLGELLNGRR